MLVVDDDKTDIYIKYYIGYNNRYFKYKRNKIKDESQYAIFNNFSEFIKSYFNIYSPKLLNMNIMNHIQNFVTECIIYIKKTGPSGNVDDVSKDIDILIDKYIMPEIAEYSDEIRYLSKNILPFIFN